VSAGYETALAEFRRVFAVLAARAGERSRSDEPPRAEIAALLAAGFGRLRVPVELGGFGVDLPTLFELLAEAGRADSNVPQILRGHFSTVELLRQSPDGGQSEHWLRKAAAGASFGNAQNETAASSPDFTSTTRLHVVGSPDGPVEVVSGEKFYSTGSVYADYIRVVVVDEDGRPGLVVVSARDPRVTHLDDWDGIGQRLTGSGTTRFAAVPVEENGKLVRSEEGLAAVPSFQQLVHLANLTGIARAVVDDAVALVRSRIRTHHHAVSTDPAGDPEVLAVVGHLYRHAQLADALLLQVGTALERANQLADAGPDAADAYARTFVDVSAAQVTIIEAVTDAATRLFNAGGASAVLADRYLDRHWRNARTLASHNPVIYKPRVIGDFVVNGTVPRTLAEKRQDAGAQADRVAAAR
jgi:alkylation response protein AidB-like acyl-CoA dehydrogenase